ncbi:hypothetical protein PC9H_000425 [Pleurotus ostreatus]|uniref:Ricin B lectin domain-containing protein n=1 Tax=Pleurotus ostreatus TaxID=5322 RepID=A0A8H7A3Q7_PLEOS|nr:uncharacterized protein PC9H_000425 [Pleurotus ostreatus]KAF7440082.1 hypothetical protein PC9H_000425 [Pleurotus ostreatus]
MFSKVIAFALVAVSTVAAMDLNHLAARQGTTTTTTTTSSTSSTTSSASSATTTATSTATTTTAASSSGTSSASSSTTSSMVPTATGAPIHPNGNRGKCMDVRGNTLVNGTPVQIYDCNGTGAQKWIVQKGQTKVRLAGTNFCLDAGSNPANSVRMKIWQCYDNLPAQEWYYTGDNRIALFNKGKGFVHLASSLLIIILFQDYVLTLRTGD